MSIRKKLFIIMSIILIVFATLSTRMLLVSRDAHLHIYTVEAILEKLFTVLETRAAMVAHTTRALDYLALGTEQRKKAFTESAASVTETHSRWINLIERRAEPGEDERHEMQLAKDVKQKYDVIIKLIEESFVLLERGNKQASYSLLEITVEKWINHVLSQKIDDAETIERGELNRSFDTVLLQIGAVPWGTKRAIRQIRTTRDALDYYLGANSLLLDFSLQFREIMDYLVSGDEKELGEFEQHGLDAKASLQLLRKAFEVHDDAGWVHHGAESQRIAVLEKNHQKLYALSTKAIAIKKEGKPEELAAYIEKKLLPFVNTELLNGVQQEIAWAHGNIKHALMNLQTVTTSRGVEVIFLTGSVLFVFGFFVFSMVRGIVLPLNHLATGTERISQGHLDHRIDLKTEDELGQLARSFDNMSESLQKSQEKIVQEKEYTENILRTMYDTLMVVSPTGIIYTVNKALCTLLSYEAQELIGQNIDKILLGGISFDNHEKHYVVPSILKTYLAKDGRKIPVSFSSSTMRDAETGALGDIVCVAQDMTRRVSERQAKARLERRLMVSEKLAAMSQLAAGLAHEIRNPLASIDVNVKNLEDECSDQNKTKNCGDSKYLAMITTEVNKLNRFMERFVCAMVPHETELQPTVCVLDDIVRNAVNRIQIPLDMKKGKVQLIGHSEQLFVECDQERLMQAFTNIIQNGVDAMPEASTITIELKRVGDWSEISICDTGRGLSPEELGQAFDFHFSTKENGMGVGLPLTQLIIEQLEGSIALVSEIGKGTCVTVNLPITDGMMRKLGGEID